LSEISTLPQASRRLQSYRRLQMAEFGQRFDGLAISAAFWSVWQMVDFHEISWKIWRFALHAGFVRNETRTPVVFTEIS
jgi:hypothetical protein